MKRIHALLLVIGLSWLALALWFLSSNVILRDTRLGLVAQLLDKLPPVIGTPIFILLWIILLLGWAVLVGLGLRPIVRKQNSN